MSQEQLLGDGLSALGLALSRETQEKLLEYLALISKWNKVHNLTAVRDPEEMVGLHLLDSLAVLPHLKCSTLLDVGSGAGLPGIPLALARPDLKVTILDSSHKKTTFQRQAKAELGISNLEVVCSRVEQFKPAQQFDCVISRAFSDIAEFLKLTAHLVEPDGHWLAMKGVYPYEELAQAGLENVEVVPLSVPGVEAHRHLVRIEAKK
ncbi:16S rRNA (guanine527-N7)-methyltransferase [Novimethylophilus kurashikiensis]|uniref:Ribosomal RNA small subunit methyltransferase G n=1 Tax=Novimethylophilus kurashikiensis TaxID=1825523 RepID=A0A2R5FA17_9PROT|nr:16S rRNA (guanine(527)-N(7))-methyltransferase RsmG [Novimethylophilus kurashikiensis]GBG13763.1 16S rRNA (guanine527-N7)-methyltransferase [Novimethylophilus kurashikiensis]